MEIDIEEIIKQRKKEYFKVRYKENRIKYNSYSKKYRDSHKEMVKKRKHEWYLKNKEILKVKKSIYYFENKEKIKIKKALYYQKKKKEKDLLLCQK